MALRHAVLAALLEGEASVVFGFDDPVVVRAQQLAVAETGDTATRTRFDVIDIASGGGFVAARGVLAVPIA